MEERQSPPFYCSPHAAPSGLALLRGSLADPASVIPNSIYHDWAVKLSGPGMPLVLSHPESVRQVLLDKGETFGRNSQLRRLMRRAWGNGLAAAEGQSWALQRRAAAPAFKPPAVEAAVPLMAATARRVLGRWEPGRQIELREQFGRIVTEVVVSTLLGRLESDELDCAALDIPPVTQEVGTFGLLDAIPLPDRLVNRLRRLGRSPAEARLRRLAGKLATAAPAVGGSTLVDLLRGAGPLADNALGFMVAGLETTALGAAWAAYLLALYPDWQDKVRTEARAHTPGASEALPLTRQVVMEALRLYPPAPILVRSALKRTTIQGHRLWPHQAVIVPIYAIHRHRGLWDAPDTFNPGRFGPGKEHQRSAYLPFGAGPRLCIAASFATLEITVIVSELLKAFRIVPSGPSPEVSLRVSTHSRTGLHISAEPL